MQMRPQIQIQSVIKALSDVVLPAIDPSNKLAIEQGKLSIGLLALLAQQLPNQFRFDCDELSRLIATARELVAQAKGGEGTRAAVATLYQATQVAGSTLDAAQASPAEVEAMVRTLRVTTGQLVTEVYRDGEAGCRAGIRDAVLAMSKEQLLRDRSMLLMQGWEPDPKAVPPIASLLDASTR